MNLEENIIILSELKRKILFLEVQIWMNKTCIKLLIHLLG